MHALLRPWIWGLRSASRHALLLLAVFAACHLSGCGRSGMSAVYTTGDGVRWSFRPDLTCEITSPDGGSHTSRYEISGEVVLVETDPGRFLSLKKETGNTLVFTVDNTDIFGHSRSHRVVLTRVR